MNFEMRVPDVAELTEFFGSEPVERSAEDGYWCYEFTDEWGIQIRLSFNIFERSLQTTLSSRGHQIATVVHEQADDLVVRDGCLSCVFSSESSKTTLTVHLQGGANVRWSTLQTA
jgi:hypothetical protein